MSADKTAKSARERVLETAEELFYREGIRAIGVDTIIARSGVAKMSLYRNFPSKDDLIVAYLQVRSDRFWRWWDKITAPREDSPRGQIQALFQALFIKVNTPGFRGCPFINTATEFPAEGHPAREAALMHHRKLRARFTEIARNLGAPRPEVLAEQLIILMDGVYANVGVFSEHETAEAILAAVDVLIEAQVPTK